MPCKRGSFAAVLVWAVLAGCGGGSSTPPNQAPVVTRIGDRTIIVGESATIAVQVSDANTGDTHTLRVTVSDTAIATASASGTTLSIVGVAPGVVTVAVTATDSSGSDNATSATRSFTVTVTTASGWIPGVFEDAANFKDLCAVPRTGVDPGTGADYPDQQGEVADENNWLRSWSNDTYLWYAEIEDADPGCCPTPEYFAQLKTFATTPSGAAKDQYHYTEDTETRRQRYQSGVSAGYGIRWALPSRSPPRDIRVAYVERNSPAEAVDLGRGSKVLAIDGVDAVHGSDVATLNAGLFPRSLDEDHEFVVLDPGAAEARTVTLTSATVTADPVRDVRIIETDSGPVGYLLFNSHIATAERQLMDAVEQLATAGVVDLALDLRYNGGGYLDIASQLGYMVAGAAADAGQTFSELEFNDKHTIYNPVTGALLAPIPFRTTTVGFSVTAGQALPSLDLPRVFVLAGSGTCSASESLLNGLRGIDIDVVLIGATTCGKPYGFYPQDNCGTTYSTVQFRSVNAAGFGDYADGFAPANTAGPGTVSVPGCTVADDFDHGLGEREEARLAAALEYRIDGSCPESAGASGPRSKVADALAVGDPAQEVRGEMVLLGPGALPMDAR